QLPPQGQPLLRRLSVHPRAAVERGPDVRLTGGISSMPADKSATANRRSSRRQPAKGSTRILCQKGALGLGPNLALSVLDISETGIRFLARQELPKGQAVTVTLQAVGRARPLQQAGAVVWCVPAADGRFCTGVHFEKPIPYADIQGLASSW